LQTNRDASLSKSCDAIKFESIGLCKKGVFQYRAIEREIALEAWLWAATIVRPALVEGREVAVDQSLGEATFQFLDLGLVGVAPVSAASRGVVHLRPYFTSSRCIPLMKRRIRGVTCRALTLIAGT